MRQEGVHQARTAHVGTRTARPAKVHSDCGDSLRKDVLGRSDAHHKQLYWKRVFTRRASNAIEQTSLKIEHRVQNTSERQQRSSVAR